MKKSTKIFLGIILAVLVFVAGSFLMDLDFKNLKTASEDTASNPLWEGTWVRLDSNNFDYSEIKISNVTAETFEFELYAKNGLNSGHWGNDEEGFGLEVGSTSLSINGLRAYYEDKSSTDTLGDGTIVPQCHADFILSKDKQGLHIDTNCDFNGYAGFGVSFVGDYRKDVEIEKLSIENSLLFSEEAQLYNSFKKLVGVYIEEFDATAMLEENSSKEEGNLLIGEFAVAHGFTLYESIIMVSPNGKIWAAMIGGDYVEEKRVVRYFTNVPEWKNKLPEEIEAWRQDFLDYPVIYQNK